MHVNQRQVVTALLTLVGFIAIALFIFLNGPTPKFKPQQETPTLRVEATQLNKTRYQFELSSFGTVQPRTQTLLVSQVSGVITEVNPTFKDGGFFNRGDVLIQMDDRDYQAAAKVAQAELLQAALALEEEQARAKQAEIDWARLGDGKDAPALVLRQPQLAAAEAKRYSAQANYEKAQLDLERTKIRAPFDGRVKSAQVDLGQYINQNSALAEVFATDVVEIRLPLKNSELSLIDLPENYRNQSAASIKLPSVTIISDLGQPQQWQGKIVRTEAAIDPTSHQLYVVAQIEDPFAVEQIDKTPLKIGQYVTAKIEGKSLDDALVVPTSSVYQGSYVYTANGQELLRKNITIAFQTPSDTVIKSGTSEGDWVITSPMGQVSSGTKVAIIDQPSSPSSPATASVQSTTKTAGVKP
ncbi:MAG: efflux RND transporter periplasmic adaptor subunit [Cellvibrionaceae bacterium]